MPIRFSLRELEVFCAIACHGNVSRAADELAMTQSAASQALAKLEHALSNQLFDRHGRRLVLTRTGAYFVCVRQSHLDAGNAGQAQFRLHFGYWSSVQCAKRIG
ncbi:helix-turn-helix domain-containing protein [Pseudorhodoferax soli]|uniref:helix-turn-helix domain-containing protein n=1 Tax=Pseudorhodoferax soli TaxID=545864 RepID=UPI000DF3D9AB|nr:LysR family transcriptional regulator [Pseudorhodoferax soli]